MSNEEAGHGGRSLLQACGFGDSGDTDEAPALLGRSVAHDSPHRTGLSRCSLGEIRRMGNPEGERRERAVNAVHGHGSTGSRM